MILSKEDSKLFFKLWMPLLDFTNKMYGLKPNMGEIKPGGRYDSRNIRDVADKLWSDVSVIDKYINKAEIAEEYEEIVLGWKKFKKEEFIIERYLKKGAVFISVDSEKVYSVCGITESIETMLLGIPLPLLLNAVLIPFKGVIITDGVLNPNLGLGFGSGYKALFKDTYMKAKRNKEIIYSL